MTIVGNNPDAVIGGVDTHPDAHVAAAINHVGGVLGVEAFATTRAGYRHEGAATTPSGPIRSTRSLQLELSCREPRPGY